MTPLFFKAAVSALTILTTSAFSSAQASPTLDNIIAKALPEVHTSVNGDTPFEIRVDRARKGSEGIELGARLRAQGGLIRRPVDWRIYRDTDNKALAKKPLFSRSVPVAEFKLKPGRYIFEAKYGLVTARHNLEIKPGQYVGLTMVLNVGGIRPLSKISSATRGLQIPAFHKIIRLDGIEAGKVVKTEITQGEIIRLGAGKYRIVSEFLPGNTHTEKTVKVKPGILTSLEIFHKAGLVNINIDAEDGEVSQWQINQDKKKWSARGFGRHGQLVLAPGSYTITAKIAEETIKRQFTVKSDQEVTIPFK